jgi:Restriction endonuclease NaeI
VRSRPASGRLVPRTRRLRTEPRHIPGQNPPARSDDPELWMVRDELHRLDPTGERMATVLRDTIDQLLDGERTGRWDWLTLHKTEKTHMGTLVEINLHKEFEFADGAEMDYHIAGIDVDCKFSQQVGGWELPPESIGHLCLVLSSSDDEAIWSAGLIRVEEILLRGGAGNRDMKRRLTDEGESRILWLFERAPLPPNLFLELDDDARERIFTARTRNHPTSGQARLKELFRTVQGEIVRRAVVCTVAMQDDSMKRARDCRLEQHLGREGFVILGHQEQDPEVAEALALPRPRKGQFVSVRIHPADPGDSPVAEIGGSYWRIARPDDPAVSAPRLRRASDES